MTNLYDIFYTMLEIKVKLQHYPEPIDPKLIQHAEAATTESE